MSVDGQGRQKASVFCRFDVDAAFEQQRGVRLKRAFCAGGRQMAGLSWIVRRNVYFWLTPKSLAPSPCSLLSVWSLWYSMTLRFLKYWTWKHSQLAAMDGEGWARKRTQLEAQLRSNWVDSVAHALSALSDSRTLSMMLFLSRQAK